MKNTEFIQLQLLKNGKSRNNGRKRKMIDYLYDGTFEGLLTCIYHHYYTDKASGICEGSCYQPNMLSRYMEVATDEIKAITVYEAIERKISSYDLRHIYKVYLSCDDDKEMKILRYVVRGFKVGPAISMLHGDDVVSAVETIEKKINVERERMMQFVRFSVMEGDMLYAGIEPDNDIIELIAAHFSDRFRSEPFIIHDLKRDKAVAAYGGHWYISDFTADDIPEKSSEEQKYRDLWKIYFDNIAIKERRNPKCQRSFMPARYWKHLTEVQI